LVITGSVEKSEDGNAKIRAKNITLLENITREMEKVLKIRVDCAVFPKDDLKKLRDLLFGLKGKAKVSIELQLNGDKKLLNLQELRVDHAKADILYKHFANGLKFEVVNEILS